MRRLLRLWDLALFLALLGLVYLLLAPSAWAAPTLSWDPVTTGIDGQPLDPGLAVTEYRIYACGPGTGSCSRASATWVGATLAPATAFDLAGLPVPAVYLVTAVNPAGESADSLPAKVVPPDVPKHVRVP